MVKLGEYIELAVSLQSKRKLRTLQEFNDNGDFYSTQMCMILELTELVKTLEKQIVELKAVIGKKE